MFKIAITTILGMAIASFAFAQDGCLNKSEVVLSEKTSFGPCVLTEPLELRTKKLYCENQLLDEWLYWAGKYVQKEKTVSKVLVQITNTCAGKVIRSETQTKTSEKNGTYYISDDRSLYPGASGWFVHRYADRVDHIKASDCGAFSDGTKRNEREELISEFEARNILEQERLNCERNKQ